MRRIFRKLSQYLREWGLWATIRLGLYGYAAYPFSQRGWRKRKPPASNLPDGPRFHIVLPTYNSVPAYLTETVRSLLAQTYPHFTLHLSDGGSDSPETLACLAEIEGMDARIHVQVHQRRMGISDNTNAALSGIADGYIVFCDHDDLLEPNALEAIAGAILRTDAELLYTDEDLMIRGLRVKPHFKSGFSPDRLRSSNYICHLTAVSAALLGRVGPLRPALDGSQDHDLVLRLSERTQRIAHVPQVLYHWRQFRGQVSADNLSRCLDAGRQAVQEQLDRLGEKGTVTVEGRLYRCRYDILGEPLVSVIVCGRTQARIDRAIDRWSGDTWPHKELLPAPLGEAGCYAAMDGAARRALGGYLLFVDADTVPLHAEFIAELLMHAQRDGRGVAAPLLLGRGKRILHAGYALDGDGAVYSLLGRRDPHRYHSFQSYGGVCGNVYAASRAAMMVRTDRYRAVGGFDPASGLGDVDLCARLSGQGLLHVYTPYARARANKSAVAVRVAGRVAGRVAVRQPL